MDRFFSVVHPLYAIYLFLKIAVIQGLMTSTSPSIRANGLQKKSATGFPAETKSAVQIGKLFSELIFISGI